MKKNQKNKPSYIGLGIIFGAAIGTGFEYATDGFFGISTGVGVGFGILVGALFEHYNSRKK